MNLAFSLFSPAFVLPGDEAKCLFVVARGALFSAFYLPEAKERFVSKKKQAVRANTRTMPAVYSCCISEPLMLHLKKTRRLNEKSERRWLASLVACQVHTIFKGRYNPVTWLGKRPNYFIPFAFFLSFGGRGAAVRQAKGSCVAEIDVTYSFIDFAIVVLCPH